MAAIRDVAQKAGVSISTVSAVINGRDCVRPATRQRVLDAIQTLGYIPNIAARELVTQKKQNIGLILMTYERYSSRRHTAEDGEEMMYSEYINTLSWAIQESGYGLLVEYFCYTPNQQDIPRIVKEKRVAGVIVAGSIYPDEFIKRLNTYVEAVVTIGCKSNFSDYVINNYKDSIVQSVKLLADMGHTRIAYMSGDPVTSAYPLKMQGFREGCHLCGVPIREDLIRSCRYTATEGYQLATALCELPRDKRPTAFVCASDILATAIYRYAYEHQLRIPEDFSLVGYENLNFTMYIYPRLTSIDWNKFAMTENAFRLVLDRLSHPREENRSIIVPCRIIKRESIAQIDS